jgi:cell division inhibitor SepF
MVYLGLAEEDEGYIDDDYDADDDLPVRERSVRRVDVSDERELEAVPARRHVESRLDAREARRHDVRHAETRLETRLDPRSSAVRAPEPVRREVPEPAPATASYKITTLQPSSYNEARQIGEAFRDGIPVIMNLTEMADGDAKRLVDFAAGLIFGLRGSIEKVTNKVFLLSPSNVRVSAEDKRLIAEGGFYNQS